MARTGRRKPAQRRRKRNGRRRGITAVGTGVAAIAGGVWVFIPHHQTARIVASSCGLASCDSSMPSPAIASIGDSPTPKPSRTPKPHTSKKPKPQASHSAAPRATAAPNPPVTHQPGPPPPVTVTYTVVQQFSNGFQGRFVITNNSGSALDGWQLTATLAGDQIMSASGSAYQANGDSITFDQALLQGPIGPGNSLTLTFNASGTNTSPSSCSLDGNACAT